MSEQPLENTGYLFQDAAELSPVSDAVPQSIQPELDSVTPPGSPERLSPDALHELTHQAIAGDVGAFTKIFLDYEPTLRGILRRKTPGASADDVLQTTFIKGAENVAGFEQRGYSLQAWLAQIAVNTAVDTFRLHEYKLRDQSGQDPSDVLSARQTTDNIENEVIRADYWQELMGAIEEHFAAKGKNFATRSLIEEIVVGDMRNSEYAKIHGMNRVTVGTRLHKVMREIRAAVEADKGAFKGLLGILGV